MTVQQYPILPEQAGRPPATLPEPVSIETIEVIEQVLQGMLRELRDRVATQAAAAVEYESWLELLRCTDGACCPEQTSQPPVATGACFQR